MTPTEFAALDPAIAAEVEEVLADMASKPEHDSAWFARNRAEIRFNLGFFFGVDLPEGT